LKIVQRLSGVLFLVGLLVAWETIARLGLVTPDQLPAPSAIAHAMVTELLQGDLAIEFLRTMRRLVIGYAIAVILGTLAGFALGRWRLLYAATEPIIEFFRPLPVIAVLPVAVLMLGLGDAMAYSVIAFGSGWVVLLHAMDGVRGIDPVLIDTGRTFQVSGLRQFSTIILPAAAPQTFTGLRVALGNAVIVTVVVELVSGFGGGLGGYIGEEQGASRTPEAYAGIILVAVLGYGIGRLFGVFEGSMLRWHRQMMGR
jgi:ABC-type nitrate/sulfonate/bicarbonate transport system permease component